MRSARAHAGEGPTLIEALTYRVGPHTTADDAGRYRDDEEVERWRALDPIARFRTWLLASGHADDAFVAECDARGRGGGRPHPRRRDRDRATPDEWMFDWTYADPPEPLLRQRTEALGDA